MNPDAKTRVPRLGLVLASCGLLAIIGGSAELLTIRLIKAQQPLLRVSQDYAWSIPLALLVTVLAAALPFALAHRLLPRAAFRLALFAAAGVVFLDLLLLVPRLAPYAAALLAAGLATQTSRVLWRDEARTAAWVRRAMPPITVIAVGLAAFVWWFPTGRDAPAPVNPGQGPNVLIITLDTVRAESLSLYGYARQTTPRLSGYAERGVVFDRAFSTAPWTLPSHASLFTGRWPHELDADYTTPLGNAFPTLAEYFGSRGYATGGFVANLGYCSRETGLSRGFSRYEDYPRTLGQFVSNSTLLRNVGDNFSLRRWIQNDEHLNRVTAADLNARVLSWLAAPRAGPFFAFLNYFDAHEPYLPPAPFDRTFGPARKSGKHSPLHHAQWNPAAPSRELDPDDLREEIDAYDGAIASLDHHLGSLLDELDARGLLRNTLVVVTADHGEEFAEHRVLEHGYSLYRQSVHVPLLMMLPGSIPAQTRVAAPVSLRDVATTVAALAARGAAHPFPGVSLSGLWTPEHKDHDPRRLVLTELTRPPGRQPDWFPISRGDMVSVVYRGMRYIRNGDATEELYDLEADPAERLNLVTHVAQEPLLAEIRTTLAAALRARDR